MKKLPAKIAGITTLAVEKATGRSWVGWIELLDKAGAKSWPHAEIAQWLQKKHLVNDWWSQMVTVGYEQTTGRRVKNQKNDGFEISVSKTIAAPVAVAFEAWKDAAIRERWLPRTPLSVRKATPHKSIRILWPDETTLSVNFWPKGPLKCQVVPEHSKLPDAATAERMKTYWTVQLDALCAFLEQKA
ncbi:MAG: hypothetical protein HZA32_08150 [Opitutae bacterium]|nr:hypothetical protein [Opitutae bacterium]